MRVFLINVIFGKKSVFIFFFLLFLYCKNFYGYEQDIKQINCLSFGY